MKPKNWDEMKTGERFEYARELLNSMRGQFILGQALAIASDYLMNKPDPHKEISNAEDMKILGSVLFPIGYILYKGENNEND